MTDDSAQNRWRRGQSGNPRGKPKGARNKVLIALDAIGAEGAEDVLRKVVADAKGGDMRAAEVLLARVWPARKGRTLRLDMPPVISAADLPRACRNAPSNGLVTAAVVAANLGGWRS